MLNSITETLTIKFLGFDVIALPQWTIMNWIGIGSQAWPKFLRIQAAANLDLGAKRFGVCSSPVANDAQVMSYLFGILYNFPV